MLFECIVEFTYFTVAISLTSSMSRDSAVSPVYMSVTFKANGIYHCSHLQRQHLVPNN